MNKGGFISVCCGVQLAPQSKTPECFGWADRAGAGHKTEADGALRHLTSVLSPLILSLAPKNASPELVIGADGMNGRSMK